MSATRCAPGSAVAEVGDERQGGRRLGRGRRCGGGRRRRPLSATLRRVAVCSPASGCTTQPVTRARRGGRPTAPTAIVAAIGRGLGVWRTSSPGLVVAHVTPLVWTIKPIGLASGERTRDGGGPPTARGPTTHLGDSVVSRGRGDRGRRGLLGQAHLDRLDPPGLAGRASGGAFALPGLPADALDVRPVRHVVLGGQVAREAELDGLDAQGAPGGPDQRARGERLVALPADALHVDVGLDRAGHRGVLQRQVDRPRAAGPAPWSR